jgi:hypothetical protein
MLAGMAAAKPKHRWFQYSLRTLLVFVTLCAFACSWLAVKMRQAERQREAATAIEKLGGDIEWDNKASGWPTWLRKVLGDDFFNSVSWVSLSYTGTTDAGLEHLKRFSQLRSLSLIYTRRVTDAGLGYVKGLSQLQELDLSAANITDAGLEHLKGLNQLQDLLLRWTPVTDAGLEHLRRLSQLRSLDLTGTQVTDEGVKRLHRALPKCHITH